MSEAAKKAPDTTGHPADGEEMTEVFEECSRCETLYRFPATRAQASRYYPPRTEPVQDIFPDLPVPARAVLTQGNVCGLCLPQPEGQNTREILAPFIVEDGEIEQV